MSRAADSAAVLFPGALGDFLCFLPTLCRLRERHAGRLLLLAQPALLDLVGLHDAQTASIDRRAVADLFAPGASVAGETRTLFGGFTFVYSWTGFGDAAVARRLALASGGQVCVYAFRGMQPGEHAVDYYARCVGAVPSPAGASVIAEDPSWLNAFLQQHGLAERPPLLMHPGSGSPRKNWRGFDEVARYWRAHYADPIVLLRGPAEMHQAPRANVDAVSLAGLTLPQVAALLRRCTLYLGNDSGISHLAAATGVPGVAVFGPSDPAVWAPRGGALEVIHAPEPCARCGADVFCVHRLPPETVIAALEALRSVQG